MMAWKPSHRLVVVVLSILGLLPFYAAIVLILLGHDSLGGRLITYYSLAIVCFISGSWWGFGLAGRPPSARTAIVLTSNLVVIIAVVSLLFLPVSAALIAMALLLLGQLAIETSLKGLTRQPVYYRRMRRAVTTLAVIPHGIAAWLLTAN